MTDRAQGPGRKSATVHLDRERKLRYTMAAVEEIQDRFGVDLVAGEGMAFQGVDDITWIVYVGLKHAGETPDWEPSWWQRILLRLGLIDPPKLSPEHVSEWIDMQNVAGVTEAIYDAMGQSTVSPEDMPEPDVNPTQPEPASEEAKKSG